MKIHDVSKRHSSIGRRSPLKSRVLDYLESHGDEVFPYRDAQIATDLGIGTSALGFTLWALEREGSIAKASVDGKVYFGSHKAIADLKKSLAPVTDPFERAYQNLLRIRERVGNLNNLEVLDAVRSGE